MVTILKHLASTASTFGTALFVAALFDQKGIDWFYLSGGIYSLILGLVFIVFAACMEEDRICN